MKQIADIKVAFSKYKEQVDLWLESSSLTDLKQYSDLQNKDIIGTVYRNDQNYFEQVSSFKAKFYSVKSYLLSLKDGADRASLRELTLMLDYIESQIRHLDIIIAVAKQRIKFYESLIYLISNMSYGDF